VWRLPCRALRVRTEGFRERWFRYVSGDKSVAVAGAPPPRAAPPSTIPREPLHHILCAAGAALCLGDQRLWTPFERAEPVASRGERIPDWELPDALDVR
jgi:hypothetical protein